ncbi:hypothetical protein ABZY42_32825 [Streptomyces sp. NPDC006622]|uniref:hypothetical protein n=1 Tax=Streptomyces sp. NPDC006622 TaxID=3155459 RepID=UPI0033B878C6
MHARTLARSIGIGCTVALGALVSAQPASAGGILPIAGPAFGNLCHNTSGAAAGGTATGGPSTAGGNVAQLPQDDSYQHCGGAELPMVGILGGLGGLGPGGLGLGGGG